VVKMLMVHHPTVFTYLIWKKVFIHLLDRVNLELLNYKERVPLYHPGTSSVTFHHLVESNSDRDKKTKRKKYEKKINLFSQKCFTF
jgi:hypothetical protein